MFSKQDRRRLNLETLTVLGNLITALIEINRDNPHEATFLAALDKLDESLDDLMQSAKVLK